MSHYEQRLQQDLDAIRKRVAVVAAAVEAAIKDSVHALLTGNRQQANAIILGDAAINRQVYAIDRLCHAFIARHLPSAGHLRLMSGIIHANIELERIGDYAVTIARESVQLPAPPEKDAAREIELFSQETQHMLHQAIDAFNAGNAEQARATKGMADQIEHSFDNIFQHLAGRCREHAGAAKATFALFVVFNMLERVSDQAKNICEETLFIVSGESKPDKVYRILFLDPANDCSSQMAEAIARRQFSNSGIYRSAGRQAAAELNPAMAEFMSAHGFDFGSVRPRTLDAVHGELSEEDIIISLQGMIGDYVEELPFHTTALEWDVGGILSGMDSEQTEKALEEMYRRISVKLHELMTILRGEEAD